MKPNDIIIIENMELRMINGTLQVRAHKGTANLGSGMGISNGKKTVKLGSAFTTTSTSWVDVTGLSLNKQEQKKLWKIFSYFAKYKSILETIEKNLPLEFEGFDINLGAMTLHFKLKK